MEIEVTPLYFVVVVGSLDGDDVIQIDDDIDRCSHVISRHGFGRNSVDAHRSVPPGDSSGAASRADHFRRGGPSRSTLPSSFVGPRRSDDGDSTQVAPSPAPPRRGRVVFTDVDVVVVPNDAATSSPSSSGSLVADEGHETARMSQCAERRGFEAAVGRPSASSMISRIAPPRSAKSKSSSKSSSDKRPTSSAEVGDTEQAKKGERLSNYNKGPLPPSRLRPIQSPPPAEIATTAFSGRIGGVSPPAPAMDTLVEESDESSMTDHLPAKSKKSSKHRSKLLQPPKFNSPNLRPRTQSMPAGTSRAAVGSNLRPSPAFAVDPRHTNVAGICSSSDCSSPATRNNTNGIIPGSPLSVRIPKLITATDNDTRNNLLQFY